VSHSNNIEFKKVPFEGFHSSFKKKNVSERVQVFWLHILIVLDQYTPEISAIDPQSLENGLQVDTDTKELLRSLGVCNFCKVAKFSLIHCQ
jgi:hypothetical protein